MPANTEIPGATAPGNSSPFRSPAKAMNCWRPYWWAVHKHPSPGTSRYIRNAALVIGAAGIFLVLIFSWSISRQVSAPLERLARAARELGAGRWNVKADTRARGEAGRVVRAFMR